ncbi:hypothetical protein [Streptomyces sp. NBC_01262]|uniref:hypothetical protein n=1 Tax=Streptomyces sp. NBC_01262 TaxID=2903803 RepID=UPI002E31122A|nr:hypothetical protein [Streptomyces sp. NBC_01262]
MANFSGPAERDARCCAFCTREMPPQSGRGRRRRYCDRRCQSAAERVRIRRRLALGVMVEQQALKAEMEASCT